MSKKKLSSPKISTGTQSSSKELLTTAIGQSEQVEILSDIEVRVTKYEERLGQPLPVHNKEILRGMIKKEDEFWETWDAREDNYNTCNN